MTKNHISAKAFFWDRSQAVLKQEPSFPGAKPSFSGAKPSFSKANRSYSEAKPSFSGERPSFSGARPRSSGATPNVSEASFFFLKQRQVLRPFGTIHWHTGTPVDLHIAMHFDRAGALVSVSRASWNLLHRSLGMEPWY